jgi:hypothetical protein
VDRGWGPGGGGLGEECLHNGEGTLVDRLQELSEGCGGGGGGGGGGFFFGSLLPLPLPPVREETSQSCRHGGNVAAQGGQSFQAHCGNF